MDSTTRRVIVTNLQGLHARPAHAVVTLATRFKSEIEMIRDGEIADAKSILAILTLAAEQGTEITIRAKGEDAGEAIEALSELFGRGFGEAVEQAETESEAGGPSS